MLIPQDEPPMLRESAIPLLSRPRIELTLVEEDEEHQLTIRAQNPERKTSTVSAGGGLAFEIFTDPKRKFSAYAPPTEASKASLENSDPHVSRESSPSLRDVCRGQQKS